MIKAPYTKGDELWAPNVGTIGNNVIQIWKTWHLIYIDISIWFPIIIKPENGLFSLHKIIHYA